MPPTPQSCRNCAWASRHEAPDQPPRLHCLGWATKDKDYQQLAIDAQACELFEERPTCEPCGACCREAFDSVPVTEVDERRLTSHPQWIRQHSDGWRDLQRTASPLGHGTRCVALDGDGDAMPFRCRIYTQRPSNCRELAIGSHACLIARRRVRLSPLIPGQRPDGPLAQRQHDGLETDDQPQNG